MLWLVPLLVVVLLMLHGTVSLKVSGPHLADGVYSDPYIVKGIGIGHEFVSVHLLKHHWKDMADKIVPTVAEHMSLPSNWRDMVSVDSHLYPQNPVFSVGSEHNFFIQAEATVGQGTTQVFLESSSMDPQTTARVVMDDILVDAPKEILTNVPFFKRGYKFSVKLRMSSVGNYKGVPFDCKVEPRYVGYALPRMDLDDGSLYCLFFPYSPEYLLRSLPRFKDLRSWPILFVSIKASLREANQVSGSAPAVFIGGFSILEMSQETMVLNLTPDFNTSLITLVGNTDVQVHFNGRDLIKVSPINREDFGIGGRVVYEVKVLRAITFSEKIIITLPLNGQMVEIEVNFREGDEVASGLEVIDYFLFLLVAGEVYCVVAILKKFPLKHNPPPLPQPYCNVKPPLLYSPLLTLPQPYCDDLRNYLHETRNWDSRRQTLCNTYDLEE